MIYSPGDRRLRPARPPGHRRSPIRWRSRRRALFGVAIVDLWHWWGFLCVIFFAALRQVPQEQIEAARLEGASFFQMMRYVLLPGDPADHHADDGHDRDLVVPGLRLRLHPDPGRAGLLERSAVDAGLPQRLLRPQCRAGGGGRRWSSACSASSPPSSTSACRRGRASNEAGREPDDADHHLYRARHRAAFVALFPIALLVLNSLKPAAADRAEPAVAARGDPLGQFHPRLEGREVQPDLLQLGAADRR